MSGIFLPHIFKGLTLASFFSCFSCKMLDSTLTCVIRHRAYCYSSVPHWSGIEFSKLEIGTLSSSVSGGRCIAKFHVARSPAVLPGCRLARGRLFAELQRRTFSLDAYFHNCTLACPESEFKRAVLSHYSATYIEDACKNYPNRMLKNGKGTSRNYLIF